ncbi:adenine nucleotide alpha hydrolases-like protein [Ophiobolus disseminans]|uniref:Diphthine--ammonia ligase n=1 Tax=Ophiobolus disseminans TaxID=1469910 RepID=A0A6A7AGJ7_9PLEO|nr:adenine nucleotide alpha hydrolases-like protein [Ophiobolus disseminans]
MASSLNVIALVSGGKDSLFSILHCQANGHKVVALANLHPTQSTSDNEDIDSYMYQTVGHSIIPFYEQALEIPLYRQEITGTAVNSSRDYEESAEQEQDETEDLVPLLRQVIDAHPEANAVSTGAILSTYQRTRVESVALRLGLTPLSYLWQYPLLPPYTQSSLLHDMAAVRQEAIIIKTASGGLDESFLGLNVADRKTIVELSTTMARFGEAGNGAIVGEGGEFETLALDGPKPLWKKRIRIEDSMTEVIDGGQTVLKIKASMLEGKDEITGGEESALRIPHLFDEEFWGMLETEEKGDNGQSSTHSDSDLPVTPQQTTAISHDDPSILDNLPRNIFNDTPTVFTYSNLVSNTQPSSSSSPSRQLTKILLRLDHMLKQRNLAKSNINHCTLLLRNMTDFTTLNPVQAISVQLPPATAEQNGAGEIVYVAGQIPLLPAPMTVYTDCGFKGQALLSLQHLWRIGRAKSVKWWTAVVGFIPTSKSPEDHVRIAQDMWKGIHTPIPFSTSDDEIEDEDVDPWDRLNQHRGSIFNDATYRAPIPDNSTISSLPDSISSPIPPCFIAQVESLPRDVDIEWSATGLTSTSITLRRDAKTTITTPTSSRSRFYTLEIRNMADLRLLSKLGDESVVEWTSATLYIGRGFNCDENTGMKLRGVQWIPCKRVWGECGREVKGVLVGRVDREGGEGIDEA